MLKPGYTVETSRHSYVQVFMKNWIYENSKSKNQDKDEISKFVLIRRYFEDILKSITPGNILDVFKFVQFSVRNRHVSNLRNTCIFCI